jgi:sugar lactone lactonase YvrE
MRRFAPLTSPLNLVVAALALAGCSAGAGPPSAPAGQGAVADSVSRSAPNTAAFGVRLPLGFSFPQTVKAEGPGWLSADARAAKGLLYVADQSGSAVEIYKQKGTNQSPVGKITTGISGVDGLFVDSHKNLYACDFGNGTVTVYPPGGTSPSETLTGAGSPIDVVVALDGTVYVANYNSNTNGTVLIYPKGQTTSSGTLVTFGTNSFPEGLAIDSKGNIYVAFNTNDGEVLEFPPNSNSGTNLGIHVGYVGGLTIDKKNELLLVDQDLPGVDVFPQGSTTPSQQIKGFALAFDVAINRASSQVYVSTPFGGSKAPAEVSRVAFPAGTVDDTIRTGLSSAFGVATSPDGSD